MVFQTSSPNSPNELAGIPVVDVSPAFEKRGGPGDGDVGILVRGGHLVYFAYKRR
jgi:hypothetical protein